MRFSTPPPFFWGTPFEDNIKDKVSLRNVYFGYISLVEEFWKKMVKKI